MENSVSAKLTEIEGLKAKKTAVEAIYKQFEDELQATFKAAMGGFRELNVDAADFSYALGLCQESLYNPLYRIERDLRSAEKEHLNATNKTPSDSTINH